MWSVALLVSLCGLTQGLSSENSIVSTKAGVIKGTWSEDGFTKFLGVPYGVVDESNPFGPSVAHAGFEGTFEANNDSIICPQTTIAGNTIGTIQCLSLNIFVPDNASSANPLPVMVWIHGGGFNGGSANGEASNPVSLLRHDVIVVAINYRVGVYGFMCLDIPEVPGNQGLKDQVLALRWINDNIESFGGDVNKITLFGESAGGMSVNLHLFSEYEKLYSKVIIESGSALSYWMMVESNKNIPLQLAKELGYNTTDVKRAVNYLSSVDIHTLVKTVADFKSDIDNNQPLAKPCVEKQFNGVENFLIEHPMNVKSTKVSTTPIIIGHNNNELAMEYALQDAEYFNTYDLDTLFKLGFNMKNDLSNAKDTVKHFYFGDDEISESVKWDLVNLGTDFIFGHSTQRMAQKLYKSGAKVYRYVFSYNGSRNDINGPGASHRDELNYLFDINNADTETTPNDLLVIDRITKLWTNFAKYGDPTPETSELIPVKWEPITKTKQQYLEIDSNLTFSSRPAHERMAFWDVFYEHYGKYQKWYKEKKQIINKKKWGKNGEGYKKRHQHDFRKNDFRKTVNFF